MKEENNKKENEKRENQNFRKWMYVFFGLVFIVYAFRNSSANGVDEMAIYTGVAFIIFAFFSSMRKAGWFNIRGGSMAERFTKWLYPTEETTSKKGKAKNRKK